MHNNIASRIMRTTIDIDDPILRELKKLRKRERKSLGRIVSDLLARALSGECGQVRETPVEWITKPMGGKVDLADTDALYDAMDRDASGDAGT